MLSAISLLTKLMINLGPFMRVRRLLSSERLLQVEDSQARAFAVGRGSQGMAVRSTRSLPGGVSGTASRRAHRLAWSVWVYRLVLFVGIALLVYHHFFKALGIVLFAVEIVFFVLKPIASEILMWMKLKGEIRSRPRTFVTGAWSRC